MRGTDTRVHIFGRNDMPNAVAQLVVFKLGRATTGRERCEGAAQVVAFLRDNLSADMLEDVVTLLAGVEVT